MSLLLVTAPAIEPVTLQQVKDNMRVDIADDDSVIEPKIRTARELAETFTNRAFLTQTWDLFLDAFPSSSNAICLPKPPLQSVTSVKYVDENGVQQTWANTNYTVDIAKEGGQIFPNYNVVYPTTRLERNAVEIRFIAGYGSNAQDVPEAIKDAIMMQVGHLYNNRESTAVGVQVTSIPKADEWLLYPYRYLRFGE